MFSPSPDALAGSRGTPALRRRDIRGGGAAEQVLESARTYATFFCEQFTSTGVEIENPCVASSG